LKLRGKSKNDVSNMLRVRRLGELNNDITNMLGLRLRGD